jgi:tetratricopeptide (TPR) repeat protein
VTSSEPEIESDTENLHPSVALRLAIAKFQKSRDIDDVLKSCESILAAVPDAIEAVESEVESDTECGRPSVAILLAVAKFQESRDIDGARRSYESVLAVEPASIEALIGLAQLDDAGGRTDEAERRLEQALKLRPESAAVLHALGKIYAGQKRWREALSTFQQAIDTPPVRERSMIRFDYAITLARSGDIEKAFELLVKTVGTAAANYNVGLVLREQGNLAAAENRFIAAIADNPNLQQARFWLKKMRREEPAGGSGSDSGTADNAKKFPDSAPTGDRR